MWISRDEWNKMKERVANLERANEYYDGDTFVIYDPSYKGIVYYSGHCTIPHEKIKVKTVVESILKKLGMNLEYIKGQPARIAVLDAAGERAQERK